MDQEQSELEIQRRNSLESIRKMGINPFPADEFKVSHFSTEITENYSETENNYQDVSIAGRLMQKRIMGKASFAEIQDSNKTEELVQ